MVEKYQDIMSFDTTCEMYIIECGQLTFCSIIIVFTFVAW